MPTPIVIGIAGGTGSGKTTITDAIQKSVTEDLVVISQDAYYKDFSDKSFEERSLINFDHPSSFDNELLVEHIRLLKQRKPINMPTYDFKTHSRTDVETRVEPKKIIIVEGILIFENQGLLDEMDIKIFVDTDADIRILRRIVRDMKERGRSLESIINQYQTTVRPMHLEFVEPSKRLADIIIPEGGMNKIGIEMICAQIKSILN